MTGRIIYTVKIKENGEWKFYKRTFDKGVVESIQKAFGKLSCVTTSTF